MPSPRRRAFASAPHPHWGRCLSTLFGVGRCPPQITASQSWQALRSGASKVCVTSAQHLAVYGFPKTDAPALSRATHFYKQNAPRASVLAIRGHPRASVLRNVGVEGHPFSQNGHPLNQNAILGGHQAQPVAPFRILRAFLRTHVFANSTTKLGLTLAKQF